MTNCFEINDALQLVPLAPERVPGTCHAADARVWVDLRPERSSEIEEWLDALHIGGLPRQLLLDARDHPGFYPLKQELFLVVPIIPDTSGATDTDQLAILCRENLLLTVHQQPHLDPQHLDTIGDSETWLPDRSIAGLVSAVMIDLSLGSLHRTRNVCTSIGVMEERMDREPETVEADQILDGRNEILLLRSVVSDQLPAFQALRATDKPYFQLRDAQEFMTCALANLQAADGTLTWLDQRVAALRTGFQMHAQEKTNRRLGMLTILSAIFMPITLLAGIWGMNFESMPELKYAFSYPAALGLTRASVSSRIGTRRRTSMSLPGKTMKIGGWNYHVSDQGTGDKVVMLVHGMPDDGSCWKYQAPALLNAGYRVIVPDTLGYGKTDRPVEVEHYEVGKIIAHMFEIIEKLGLKDINLVGHDWGSAITWAMLMQKPELFRKYCSLSVGHLGCVFGQAHDMTQERGTPERMLESVKTNWFTYHHTQPGMEELYMANDFKYFDLFFCSHPEKQEVKRLIKETGRIEWLNYDIANPMVMDYLATAKDPNVYPNVKVPVMVIYPEQDMFLWPTQAIDTPSRVDAECRIEFIQGGHWSMLDHPDDVNVRMLDWFGSESFNVRANVKEA